MIQLHPYPTSTTYLFFFLWVNKQNILKALAKRHNNLNYIPWSLSNFNIFIFIRQVVRARIWKDQASRHIGNLSGIANLAKHSNPSLPYPNNLDARYGEAIRHWHLFLTWLKDHFTNLLFYERMIRPNSTLFWNREPILHFYPLRIFNRPTLLSFQVLMISLEMLSWLTNVAYASFAKDLLNFLILLLLAILWKNFELQSLAFCLQCTSFFNIKSSSSAFLELLRTKSSGSNYLPACKSQWKTCP